MTEIPCFDDAYVEMIGNIFGDTNEGLTGTEIWKLLSQLSLPDDGPTTKRYRITQALSAQQELDQNGSCVVRFIEAAMIPIRYAGKRHVFEARLSKLNEVLAFAGLELQSNGKITTRDRADTLEDAEARANRLRTQLIKRGVHLDVLEFCQAELLQDNYFHAVFEATKSVAEKIRVKSGQAGDGASLVDRVFGGVSPILAINDLKTETQRSEQTGFTNLLKGMFGVFRNTTGHAPKITWVISEQDALDLMSLASYLHRRIDEARRLSP